MGGHGNAMGGIVSGRRELVSQIARAQNWLAQADGCVSGYAGRKNPAFAHAAA